VIALPSVVTATVTVIVGVSCSSVSSSSGCISRSSGDCGSGSGSGSGPGSAFAVNIIIIDIIVIAARPQLGAGDPLLAQHLQAARVAQLLDDGEPVGEAHLGEEAVQPELVEGQQAADVGELERAGFFFLEKKKKKKEVRLVVFQKQLCFSFRPKLSSLIFFRSFILYNDCVWW
jgi:hypothetical protein